MSRTFTVEEANAALQEAGPLLATLADQRAELIRLRDRTVAMTTPAGTDAPSPDDAEEARRLRLRMQGVIDQMAAAVARIDAMGITLRDIERGLIDFPTQVGDDEVWLCWQLGEADIAHWHPLDTGFGGRQPLATLGRTDP
jgi:hypothetical protein